jgi:hypothetical protein
MRSLVICILHEMFITVIKLRMRWAELVACMGELSTTYGEFYSKKKKTEERRLLGRPRRRWKYIINTDVSL